ncbi:hypothetical protein K491DRAFT_657751 [Lophiostoma macrostomum CBS 122681]|uniref:Zn(2)-C6 fungal-type domain-containing protein n=1 Tax=Lophiostoma macrostomum CBS 122681 TaxID=1314788 RepID=A0A6A6T849_9PLEO|nr:hypothetical protein K491DRAFT_657751 [Lophiostoma macrostomum CBS 122681]
MSSGDASMSGSIGKIAIPRLHRTGEIKSSAKQRQRVSRACLGCRTQKVKCSGDVPSCVHCQATGRECLYIMPRRDKLNIVTDRCVEMAILLRTLERDAGPEESRRINELLEAVEGDISKVRESATPSSTTTDIDDQERNSPHGYFDTVGLDLLDEDLSRDEQTRATGFVGMNSEVQWLRSIMYETLPGPTALHDRRRSSSFTFYSDSESVLPDLPVDSNALPDPDIGELLLGCYATTVHDSFPILSKKVLAGFHKFFQAIRAVQPARMTPRWQATLNLVLAVGAKYSHLVQASWRGDEQDHLVYQARGRKLGFDGRIITDHPDVGRIQIASLLSFYYLSIGQINRAWCIMGIGIRMAYALDLHVRNTDPALPSTEKETLVRAWWSLYTLEHLLNVVTGRPSAIVDASCSVPLPSSMPEDVSPQSGEYTSWLRRSSSTVSLSSPLDRMSFAEPSFAQPGGSKFEVHSVSYFRATIQIAVITQSILGALYSAGTAVRSLGDIQQDIFLHDTQLSEWAESLPPGLKFMTEDWEERGQPARSRSERMHLMFLYCSARISLTKPCLNDFRHAVQEQDAPETFVRRMAMNCVSAAKDVADVLPDQPDPRPLYENGPWWSLVHFLMQAASIFLLKLSYLSPGRTENVEVLLYATKLIRCIGVMQDPMARQAYGIAFNTLQTLTDRLGLDAAYSVPLPPPSSVQITQGVRHSVIMADNLIPTSATLAQQGEPLVLIDPALDRMAHDLMDGPDWKIED